ncbi:hypothetical protein A3860_02625 [Niastella vici]|uniref:DUF4595 domain-containing protein n=1 Tax=Niastella vici TaxID=1703345 RepID=A0A1V9G9D6_9BACT|nr:hypothetical protein [Niastella vici]OQP67269.1 hypothetical protein A3860_02625 [Niastella vici]
MKKIFLLAGAMAMLVLGSCKKDKNSAGDNNGGKTKLLKKLTRTENGKTTVYNFTYDGNKLTSYSSSDNLETTSFTFDGAGNITKLENKSNSYNSTYTFSYNNGIPVSGTTKVLHNIGSGQESVVQDDVLTYTVTNNQVSKIKEESKLDGTITTANLTYTINGNLEKLNIAGDEPFSVTFTYGTKKSGFPIVSKWVLDMGYTLRFSSKNETLTAFYDFPGTQFDETVNTKYTYDGDGYPLTSNDGDTQLTFEY